MKEFVNEIKAADVSMTPVWLGLCFSSFISRSREMQITVAWQSCTHCSLTIAFFATITCVSYSGTDIKLVGSKLNFIYNTLKLFATAGGSALFIILIWVLKELGVMFERLDRNGSIDPLYGKRKHTHCF